MEDSLSVPRPRLRLLLAAWGHYHVELFCKYCLPSLLAPGNIPALGDVYDCEFLVLTRAKDATLFDDYPAMAALRQYCTIKFLPIDDVIVPRSYGVTLTLAYARGITDEADDMTTVTNIFLNADFLFSDGSFRSVVSAMADGYSAVVAPSFRCVAEDFVAYLDRIIQPSNPVLTMSPRALVKYGIEMMHPSFQAKIVTQDNVTTRLTNQFLWQVDSDTMIGRFYLMFMLCIKPERPLTEVAGYCDYSFIPEMCPSGRVKIASDSDDIFILELQHRTHETEHIAFQHWDRRFLSQQLAEWSTATHRRFAAVNCFIHAGHLPPAAALVAAQADEFVADLSSDLPPPVPYLDHPYWTGTLTTVLHLAIEGFQIVREPTHDGEDAIDAPAAVEAAAETASGEDHGRSGYARACTSRFRYLGIWHPDWLDFQLAMRWAAPRITTVKTPILFLTTFDHSPLEAFIRRLAKDHVITVKPGALPDWIGTCHQRFDVALYDCDAAQLVAAGRMANIVAPLMTAGAQMGLFVRAAAWFPREQFDPLSVLAAFHGIRLAGRTVDIVGTVTNRRKQDLRWRLVQDFSGTRGSAATTRSALLASRKSLLDVLRIVRNNWRQRNESSSTEPCSEMSSLLCAIGYS